MAGIKNKIIQTYGGSAVPNGVMFSDKDHYSIAVKNSDGEINSVLETEKYYLNKKLYDIPIIRGFVLFLDMGIFIKMFKAMELYTPKEKSMSNIQKIILNILGLSISGLLIYFLFYLLPKIVGSLIINFLPFLNTNIVMSILFLTIFIGYIAITFSINPMSKSLKYFHGAEHKIINCYESGYEVNITNAKKCSTIHPRCGTSFIGYLIFKKLLIFNVIFYYIVAPVWVKTLAIVFLFSLTYELFKLVNKHDVLILLPVKKFGLWMQSFTTAEPTDEQLEIAVIAFNKLLNKV